MPSRQCKLNAQVSDVLKGARNDSMRHTFVQLRTQQHPAPRALDLFILRRAIIRRLRRLFRDAEALRTRRRRLLNYGIDLGRGTLQRGILADARCPSRLRRLINAFLGAAATLAHRTGLFGIAADFGAFAGHAGSHGPLPIHWLDFGARHGAPTSAGAHIPRNDVELDDGFDLSYSIHLRARIIANVRTKIDRTVGKWLSS